MSQGQERIKTRILIISDTHGLPPKIRDPNGPSTDDELDVNVTDTTLGFREPLPEADVVLHCGDLTKRSMPNEFEMTFTMLRRLRAPLKLVIPGNHDGAMDRKWWTMWQAPRRDPRMEIPAAVQKIVDDARGDGVQVLDEGDYTFDLANGAKLRVYASQWTPEYGNWGFQYPREEVHPFEIPSDIDIAMTHGPPRGVLDYAGYDGTHAGCDHLFRSIFHSKPRVHCFGHIHEAWGAYLATWKTPENEYDITTKTVIEEDESKIVQKISTIRPSRIVDPSEVIQAKTQRLKDIARERAFKVDISEGDNQVNENKQTLFINAAIMSIRYKPVQIPWLIDIDLPQSDSKP